MNIYGLFPQCQAPLHVSVHNSHYGNGPLPGIDTTTIHVWTTSQIVDTQVQRCHSGNPYPETALRAILSNDDV